MSAVRSARRLVLCLFAGAVCAAPALAQDTASLASKSIARVFAVQNRVFALAEGGTSFSSVDLFAGAPQISTGTWPWEGGAEGGAAWSNSLLLHANYWPTASDSQRVALVTSLRFNGSFRGGDSLVFPDRLGASSGLADGAVLTAVGVRDTVDGGPALAVFGFGRLGLAYATLAAESSTSLFAPGDSSVVSFFGLPTQSDTLLPLTTCRWNLLCRVDTLSGLPSLDSVITLAIDSSDADSTWILVGTQKGLRRGLWGGTVFPYITLPDIDSAGTPVRSVFTSPRHRLAWVFTGSRFFFSDDHGASFRVPPPVDTVSIVPSSLSGYTNPPQVAFYGDTSFVNFNFDEPGLVLFRRDTILTNAGMGLGQVLLEAEDGLGIEQGEGSLTGLAVARNTLNPSQAVLVAGSTLKGVFYRRIDETGTAFKNINRFEPLKGGLTEIITYPTLFTVAETCGDAHVRIGYRIKNDARVTITVYNYAMEKVKVIVKNAPRLSSRGTGRSENIAEDRWDGCDASGRFVSVGTYYILVQSSAGEKGFGKAIVTRGRP